MLLNVSLCAPGDLQSPFQIESLSNTQWTRFTCMSFSEAEVVKVNFYGSIEKFLHFHLIKLFRIYNADDRWNTSSQSVKRVHVLWTILTIKSMHGSALSVSSRKSQPSGISTSKALQFGIH